MDKFGSLAAALAAAPESQAKILGRREPVLFLGQLRAAMLHALRRVALERPVISTAQALHDYLHFKIAHAPAEELWVLFLDSRNHLLSEEAMGFGTIDEAPVYPREIIRRALEVGATALILAHNHPSGDASPSSADVRITTRLAIAANELNIIVHDHLIVARSGTASFRAMGFL